MNRINLSEELARIPTGISCIDSALAGGIERSIITEIYGEGGSGKTNLSLIISLSALNSGGTVYYLDTEGVSVERIRQIAPGAGEMKRFYLYRIKSLEDQELTLTKIERNIERGQKPDLVVIDSFTEYFRLEKGGDPSARANSMQKHLSILLSVISGSGCAAVITNQIYQDVQTGSLEPFGGYVINHSVKAVYRIEKLPDTRRRIELVKHRSAPEGLNAVFRITGFGIECAPG